MKKWSKIKEEIEGLDSYDCHPGEVADILQDLVMWMDEYFFGEWRHKVGPSKSQSSTGTPNLEEDA